MQEIPSWIIPGKTVMLLVYVRPHAASNKISGVYDGCLCLKISAMAKDNQANRAVIELLANTLGIAKNRLTILKGMSSKRKKIAIQGVSPQEIWEHLHSVTPLGPKADL